MATTRPSTSIVLAVAGLALLDGFVGRVLAYLPAVLLARGATGASLGPVVALGSVLTLLVSPLGAMLLGVYGATDLDVSARLTTTTAAVFLLAYVGYVAGLTLGMQFAPVEVEVAESFLVQLLNAAIRAIGGTVVVTVAVVGGAALGRLRGREGGA